MIGGKLPGMANMKNVALIAASSAEVSARVEQLRDDVSHELDQVARALDDEVERLTERIRVTEIAYLDHQAVIDAIRLDMGALECRIARLENSLPATSYEAKKGIPEG